ncbi:hypothetical protein DCCM_2704 [Desulfocucumis palustris]|uniref:Uncharacterized protein n=1 Tax=Desulfocucumis palustris TaxID=1898651 RepID=A0A2L2XBK8_9FIRM|nr:hypothetical protein DCCM_2704 [Desulfocucumis palustris]
MKILLFSSKYTIKLTDSYRSTCLKFKKATDKTIKIQDITGLDNYSKKLAIFGKLFAVIIEYKRRPDSGY